MIPKKCFEDYLDELIKIASAGDSREESFYRALEDLLREFAQETDRAHADVIPFPRPTEAGNPDFRVRDGPTHIVGYIEAKTPSTDLSRIESTEQLTRYRGTFPNLILTNFFEFRLYRNGQPIASAQLARPFILTQIRTRPPVENAEGVWALLEQFFQFSLPQPLTAESLAVELAKRTRFLRDMVRQQLATEQANDGGHLAGFYEAFQKFLIGGLTPDEFADLYAQTVTYGLFAARTRATNGFARRTAFDYIPHTVGVLRDLFRYISFEELSAELEWIVDDLAQVLADADVQGMLERFYHEGKGSDPIVHFYETFLAHYDPEERERRGVYYTPEPVVSYIVRSLHLLLKQKFDKPDGLASMDVTLLDPAAGTMTFVARAAEAATREFTEKYGVGGREAFIREHILQNFYAFELMMAPYAVGHLKMAFFLEELGHRLQEQERFPFYLTNTLDMSELEASRFPLLSSLAEESRLAGRVKRDQPILVILGNPPYSGHSANKGEWISQQIETYKKVDGKPLGEKNPKWLQDDYVKFLRFAQWKIEQAGQGVVGMITNHAYLNNPTFRGMRRSLMQTFDEIYLLDLHGNSLKRETCPDGSRDENVFDIRQGVAIAFLVKTGQGQGTVLHYAEVWGLRQAKYEWLEAHDWATTPWQEIQPRPEFYLFVPRQEAELARYNTFPKITDIFQTYSVGIVTARDRLTIHWSPEKVWATVRAFSQMDPERARQAYRLGQDARDWKVTLAQGDLRQSGPTRDRIAPILYRPFDVRYTYYTGRSRGFICMPRPEVMRHMLAGENVALTFTRQVKTRSCWQHCFVSNTVTDSCLISNHTSENGYIAPLYLYDTSRETLFSGLEPHERQPNLAPQILNSLAETYGRVVMPEEIFDYVYAILYAPSYRERYADFLRLDFPRIPFTADGEIFTALAGLGRRLVALHLLTSPELEVPLARFEGQGENRVTRLQYEAGTKRLFINPSQYFAPVPPEVWEYLIGGYQVCKKWLQDRRGHMLSLDEIRTYCRIVTALAKTFSLQGEIDDLYAAVEETVHP